jgi:hypothetical protein
MTEGRGRKTDGRGQMADGRGQKTDDPSSPDGFAAARREQNSARPGAT